VLAFSGIAWICFLISLCLGLYVFTDGRNGENRNEVAPRRRGLAWRKEKGVPPYSTDGTTNGITNGTTQGMTRNEQTV